MKYGDSMVLASYIEDGGGYRLIVIVNSMMVMSCQCVWVQVC
jgi:hypothetical protein